jgi:hypothetical protein
MRLIDEDALIEDLKKWKGIDNKTIEAVLETINKQPTAYDSEAVVAELEEKSDDIPVQYEDNYEKGFDDGIGYAIEIVRKGGV